MAGCEGGGRGEEVVEEFGAGFGGEVCSYACVEGGGEVVLAGEDISIVFVVVDIIILVVVLFLFSSLNSWKMLLLIQWRDYLGAIDDLPARYSRSGMIVKTWKDGRRD